MDHTPRPFDTVRLLNTARQSGLGSSQRLKITPFAPSNVLSKPLPAAPKAGGPAKESIPENQSSHANSIRKAGRGVRVPFTCSGCGSKLSHHDWAGSVPITCSGCQLSHPHTTSEQNAGSRPLVARSASGTDLALVEDCTDAAPPSSSPASVVGALPVSSSCPLTPPADRSSWISVFNFSTTLTPVETEDSSADSTVIGDEDASLAVAPLRQAAMTLPYKMDSDGSDDTQDLAFFLRTTGPPAPARSATQREQKRLRKLIALSKFRKRHEVFTNNDHVASKIVVNSNDSSQIVQRVSKDGTRYLQIVTQPTGSTNDDDEKENRRHSLSPSTSTTRTNPFGSQDFDAWLDEFSTPLEREDEFVRFFNDFTGWTDTSHTQIGDQLPISKKDNNPSSDASNGGFGLSILDQLGTSVSVSESDSHPSLDRNEAITPTPIMPRIEDDTTIGNALRSPETPIRRQYSQTKTENVRSLSKKLSQQIEHHTLRRTDPSTFPNPLPTKISHPNRRSCCSGISPKSSSRRRHKDPLSPPPQPHWSPPPPFPLSSFHLAPPSTSSAFATTHPLSPSLTDFPAPPPFDPQTPKQQSSQSRSSSNSSNAGSSSSKELAHLKTQLALMERQNKLLEAALQAVLWTAGSLNGCPCSMVGSGRQAGSASLPSIPASIVGSDGLSGLVSPTRDGRRPSTASVRSWKSNGSALDMYKETRF